jgi:kynurenine formamidase
MTRLFIVAVLGSAGSVAIAADTWYPSKYGKEDTNGAANNLAPSIVVEAARLVKTAKTYSLGITLGPNTPAYGTRTFRIFTFAYPDKPVGANNLTETDDFVLTSIGIGSQIDGLGHIGINNIYYNGHKQEDFLRPNGLLRFSSDKIPPIVTRGVLLDLVGLKGGNLAPGTAINRVDIEAAIAKQGAPIRKGDVVLIHTGWLESMAMKDKKRFMETEPGLGKEGAEFLASLGVVAVGADQWAVEVVPAEDPAEVFPVHQTLITKNGVYLLENMNVGPLATDKAYEFLFILGQPKLAGAVQAIINPIAIR